jgi:2-polyprenyl-6-hydroxyphenyl methylase/3-demethylubiquinone-9 3-methyltransferase
VAVDNELYDRMAGTWWDPHGFLHLLEALNPVRFGYMRRVLLEDLSLSPAGLTALDVGCGGGLLAEEFARLGFQVTGIDPSAPSLTAARAHAAEAGLSIDYRQATAESLPFEAGTFDVVYCCDVLEHVADVPLVIRESARVLKPGGVYLFDTINRTLRSKLIMIKLFQEWRWTCFMPANLHDWRMFIRPDELIRLLKQQGLHPGNVTGLTARANPLRILGILRARALGRLSYHEAAQGLDLGESPDTSVLYVGYAQKPVGAAGLRLRSV